VDTAEKRYGEELKRARASVGISQEDLADRADVHASYVSQLERGIKSPTLGVMLRLAGALGLPAGEMVRAAESGNSAKMRGKLSA
jgi:transcriptional regulator with XRE-family HTH domain